jgi:hypothetical protein
MGPTGTYWGSVFGGADLATFGMGLALTPLAFAATAGVAPTQAGLASGVLNTSRQIGASVALAALATIAAARTQSFLASEGHAAARSAAHRAALTAGFSRGLSFAALIAVCGFVAGFFVRPVRPAAATASAPPEVASGSVDRPALAVEPDG